MNNFRFLFLLLLTLNVSFCFSQTAGDEGKEMFNNAKARDQKAIDDAVHGWWTASMKTHDQRIEWWKDGRFGMFIHWGVYSLPAGEWKGQKVGGYAEHLMRKEKIPREEYLQLAHEFNPKDFNADKWAAQAKKAGMKYMIITAKHHDGFAMYDSKVSDYNIVKQSAFHRDPMKELSAACKKYGIKFGFYYSHAFDWEHPDAPGNDWDYNNPGGDKLIGGTNWYDAHPEWLPKAQKYVDEKAIPQIKELITEYHPDILWFDTPQKLPLSENIKILKAIRETDPNVVVNGRLVRSASANFGDYKNTADRPAEFYPVEGNWEAIPTTNESYGYSKYDNSHKPASHFIQLLASAASRGGNLLLNIGPKGDGTFDEKDISILNGIGKWMDKNSESIYGTERSPIPFQSWGVATAKNNKIYLHVFSWPKDGKLYVGGLKSGVNKAYLLSDPKVNFNTTKINDEDILITLPKVAPDTVNTVLVLDINDKIVSDPVRYVSANIPLTRLLAYDATQHGKGFGFGDGKRDRYYVDGWKSKDQYLTWNFRTSIPVTCQVVVKFVTDAKSGGSYEIQLGSLTKENIVSPSKNSEVITQQAGTITLSAGVHKLQIKALDINQPELMKLLEIQLIPLTNNKIK
jgi:alpha-L-fucosidase